MESPIINSVLLTVRPSSFVFIAGIGIRGFTVGYDFYAPERSVCFHHYATGANAAKRNKVKKFWENGDRYKGLVLYELILVNAHWLPFHSQFIVSTISPLPAWERKPWHACSALCT
jgi:Glycosyltransferase (GlcNAc)